SDAALRLALDLADRSHCRVRAERSHSLPPYPACLAQLGDADRRVLGAFFAQSQIAIPMPTTVAMGASWTPLGRLLSTVVSTAQPIAPAAHEAEDALARFLVRDRATPGWIDGLALVLVAGVAARWWRRRPRIKGSHGHGRKNFWPWLFLAPATGFA